MRSTADKSLNLESAAETLKENRGTVGMGSNEPEMLEPRLSTPLPVMLTVAFWVSAVLLGGLQSWASRHVMNTDGISYLDIADAIAHGDWRAGIHAYWSPLYPSLLALALKCFKPSSYWEFSTVHLVNFIIFMGAAAAFQFFLTSLLHDRNAHTLTTASRAEGLLPDVSLVLLADTLFLWSSLTLANLSIASPDLLVFLFVFLAAALVLRMKDHHPRGQGHCALLGFVLGLGYLAKTPLFPLGVLFLACAAFASGSKMRASERTAPLLSERLSRSVPIFALGLAMFLLVTLPFIAAISASHHKLTIGESATLNWAWNIEHAPRYHWQGDIAGLGIPLHPTHKLFAHPAVYAFDGAVAGTYPAWYDPSYWFAGITLSLNLRSLLRQFVGNSRFYANLLVRRQVVVAAACVFLLLPGWSGRRLTRDLAGQWTLLVPAVMGLAMYALVYVETRYVASFVVLLWLGLFSAVRFPLRSAWERWAQYTVLVAVLFILMSTVVSLLKPAEPFRAQDLFRWKSEHAQYLLAEELLRMGLESGDKVAWIRPGIFNAERRYDWARLARLRIIAEVPGNEEASFWAATPEVQWELLRVFQRTGAKALIATQRLNERSVLQWQPVGATGYFILFLED